MMQPGPMRPLAALLAVLLLAEVASAQAAPRNEPPAPAAQTAPGQAPAAELRWLPWALFGLGVVATASTLVAFGQREQHAARWNSADCSEPGQTRGSVCPEELDAIQDWDRVLWVSGASAVVLLSTAVLTRSLEPSPSGGTATAACGLGLGLVACSARF